MEILWTVAGSIIGWVFVEIIGVFTKTTWPILLNVGMAFVGGLTAYTYFTGGF